MRIRYKRRTLKRNILFVSLSLALLYLPQGKIIYHGGRHLPDGREGCRSSFNVVEGKRPSWPDTRVQSVAERRANGGGVERDGVRIRMLLVAFYYVALSTSGFRAKS